MELDVSNVSNLDNYSNINGNRNLNRFSNIALSTTPSEELTKEVVVEPTLSSSPSGSITTTETTGTVKPYVKPTTISVVEPTGTVKPYVKPSTSIIPRTESRPKIILLQQTNNPTGGIVTYTPVSTSASIPSSLPIMPVGGGGIGAPAPSGEPQGEPIQDGKVNKVGNAIVDMSKHPHVGFITLTILGGIGAYFYAKNKSKNILTSVIVGAAIGSVLGFSYDKMPEKTLNQQK